LATAALSDCRQGINPDSHPSGRRLRPCAFLNPPFLLFPPNDMIAPETFNHIENIKKRAGHLWRFL
jgi:hypothetical protein